MECNVSNSGRYVRAVIGPGDPDHVHACYRQIAVLCAQHKISRALVVSISGDPTDHFAIRDAIRTLAITGVPPDFKQGLHAGRSNCEAAADRRESIPRREYCAAMA